MEGFGKGALAVFSGIITLAIISVILSKKSDTPGFLTALGNTLSKVVSAAVTPVAPAPRFAPSQTSQPEGPGFWEGLLQQPFF